MPDYVVDMVFIMDWVYALTPAADEGRGATDSPVGEANRDCNGNILVRFRVSTTNQRFAGRNPQVREGVTTPRSLHIRDFG